MSVDFLIEESKIIQDVSILKPTISTDHRGNIWSSFTKECIESLLPDGLYFKHDKFSESRYNVLRGIHGDHKSWKLVTCVYGDIHQVVVDTRRDSSSFRKYQSFHINSKEPFCKWLKENCYINNLDIVNIKNTPLDILENSKKLCLRYPFLSSLFLQ